MLNLMMLALMAFMMGACGDDEPETPTMQVNIYNNATKVLYLADSDTPAFTATNTPGLYLAQTENIASAQLWVSNLILEPWNLDSKTVDLGDLGSLKITVTDSLVSQGIYCQITVNLKDYTPFTLQIISEERASDDNGIDEDGYHGGGVVRI